MDRDCFKVHALPATLTRIDQCLVTGAAEPELERSYLKAESRVGQHRGLNSDSDTLKAEGYGVYANFAEVCSCELAGSDMYLHDRECRVDSYA